MCLTETARSVKSGVIKVKVANMYSTKSDSRFKFVVNIFYFAFVANVLQNLEHFYFCWSLKAHNFDIVLLQGLCPHISIQILKINPVMLLENRFVMIPSKNNIMCII